FVDTLPGPETAPVLAKYESLHLAILRATDLDADRRFASIEEMADQLTALLHEIVALAKGTEMPRLPNYFSPQRGRFGAGADKAVDAGQVMAALPVPVVDARDPGAAVLATTSGTPPAQLERALELARTGVQQANRSSVEVPLRLVRASLEIG